MNRLTSTILQPGTGPAAGLQTSILDLSTGGYGGWAPDFTEWLSNQTYRQLPVIPILIEGPKGFTFMQNPEKMLAILRTLLELRATQITGLNRGLEVEASETPVGGSGEVQEDPTNVTRTRSQVQYEWDEVYGMAVARFLELYTTSLIMMPETKVANIFTQAGNKPTDQLADIYSFTMMFIEPDPTMTGVVNAWLGTNMWFKGTGEITAQRNLTQGSEKRSVSIQLAGVYQTGNGVNAVAKKLLNSMLITGANPNNRPAFAQEITADVLALTKGYKNNMENLGAQAIRV